MEDRLEQAVIDVDGPFVGFSSVTKKYMNFIEIALDTRITPVLWAGPGVGKTALINAIMRKRNMLMRTLIGSTMDPTDVAGLPVLTKLDDGVTVTAFTMPDWFHEVNEYARAHPESGACVFIDEITTATPPVQAALLTFIQDRRIGKFFLEKNVLIIAAGNPPSQAADGWQLAPPTANRLAHLDFVPSVSDWFAGMKVNWNNPMSEAEKKHRGYIVGFLTENKHLINNIPDDPDKAGRAWPSMRQWDNVARMLGQVTEKTKSMAPMIVKSCVGDEAGKEYIKWLEDLKLPNYEALMYNPNAIPWNTFRGDSLFMSLNLIINNVTVDNIEQSIQVFLAARSANKNDIVGSLIPSLQKESFNVLRAEELSPLPWRRNFAELSLAVLGEMFQASY